jgi:hypothetical protein
MTNEVARIVTPERLDALEVAMLAEEQIECPTTHEFRGGLYIREAFMPAGSVVLGHAWRRPQWNVMKQGRIRVMVGGRVRELRAPRAFIGPAGRKVAYIIEDTIWVNIFATDETDLGAVEETILDRTEAGRAADEARRLAAPREAVACLP